MKTSKTNAIALNPKASRDYFIEEQLEAGIVLAGWEVKSLRANRLQLKESYALIKNKELWLIGAHISPLANCVDQKPEPTRSRKLLLSRRELSHLIGKVERKGYTLVPLKMYWKKNLAKLQLGVAKGKHRYDKRAVERQRDWDRDKQRLLKKHS